MPEHRARAIATLHRVGKLRATGRPVETLKAIRLLAKSRRRFEIKGCTYMTDENGVMATVKVLRIVFEETDHALCRSLSITTWAIKSQMLIAWLINTAIRLTNRTSPMNSACLLAMQHFMRAK